MTLNDVMTADARCLCGSWASCAMCHKIRCVTPDNCMHSRQSFKASNNRASPMQAHKQQWHSRKSRSTSAIAHTLRS